MRFDFNAPYPHDWWVHPRRRPQPKRVFNMTIKYLSLGFMPAPPPPRALHQYSVAFVQIKLRLNFLYFPALTYVLWQALNQFYAIIDFFSNGHKPFRLLPSFSAFLPSLSLTVRLIYGRPRDVRTLPETSTGRGNAFRFYNIRTDKLNLEFYQNLYIVVRGPRVREVGVLFSFPLQNKTNRTKSLKVNSSPCTFWLGSFYNIA